MLIHLATLIKENKINTPKMLSKPLIDFMKQDQDEVIKGYTPLDEEDLYCPISSGMNSI